MRQPLDASEIPRILIFRQSLKKLSEQEVNLEHCVYAKHVRLSCLDFIYLFHLAPTTVDLESQVEKAPSFW